MVATCPIDGESLCYIKADKNGNLLSGDCATRISATDDQTRETTSFDIDDTEGYSCGQGKTLLSNEIDADCENDNDQFINKLRSTCTVVDDRGRLMFFSWGYENVTIYGNYKGEKFEAGCFSQISNRFK